jgi:hypothetical protein
LKQIISSINIRKKNNQPLIKQSIQ